MGRESNEREQKRPPFLAVCGAGPVSPGARTSRGVMIAHEANGAKVPPCFGFTEEHVTG
jgi:hypothetical protein